MLEMACDLGSEQVTAHAATTAAEPEHPNILEVDADILRGLLNDGRASSAPPPTLPTHIPPLTTVLAPTIAMAFVDDISSGQPPAVVHATPLLDTTGQPISAPSMAPAAEGLGTVPPECTCGKVAGD